MRSVLVTSTLLALAACGISEEKWSEDYQTMYCDQIQKCGSELECDPTILQSGDFCEYDKAAAKACLDEEGWGCDENDFPTFPPACLEVVVCEGTAPTNTTPTESATE